jgi:hypothetical protein
MSERESSAGVSDAQLYGWRQRIRDIDSDVTALALEREKLERLVSMMELVASEARLLDNATGPSGQHPKFLHQTLESISPREKFPKAVLAIVDRIEDGATYEDVRGAILNSPLAGRFRSSDKGFYHALARLKARGELVEHKGHVFTPRNLEVFRRKVAAGLKKEKIPESAEGGSPIMDTALGVVARHPGIIAKDVVAKIAEELTLRNEGSAYNAIARLKQRGRIEGFGRLDRQLRIGPNAPEEYKRIASSGVVISLPKRTEAPSGRAAGASEVGPLFGSPQK